MSVTIDTYKNFVKTIANGNFMPIIKGTIGHAVSGAALYKMYDIFLNQESPVAEGDSVDKVIAYLWRSELLGVFGEVVRLLNLIPGQNEDIVLLSEPVVIRNAKNAYNAANSLWKGTKKWDKALYDFGKETIVVVGQGERLLTKVNHPYASDYRRLKVLERSFRDEFNHKRSSGAIEGTKRSPYYWELKTAIMTGKTDEVIAKKYYAAFNAICHELEKKKGWVNRVAREKEAKRLLDITVGNMNPLSITTNKQGREVSLKTEFMNWMGKENRKMAEDLFKTYEFKKRRFRKIRDNLTLRKKYSIYPFAYNTKSLK